MRSLPLPLLAAGFAAITIAAQAQDAPTPLPTRDVAVTYRITDAGREEKARYTFAAQSQRVRLDLFAFPQATIPYSTIIYDRPGGRFLTLVYAQGAAYPNTAAHVVNPGALLTPGLQYTREGSTTVLDMSCTDWQFSDASGAQGTACVTEDGVVLRLNRSGKRAVAMEAVKVEYGAQPDKLFVLPRDLRLMVPPKRPG
jgi:hypothetical protein